MSLSRGNTITREAVSFPPSAEPPGYLLLGGSLFTETFEEKMARQEKQLKAGGLLLAQGREILALGEEVLNDF